MSKKKQQKLPRIRKGDLVRVAVNHMKSEMNSFGLTSLYITSMTIHELIDYVENKIFVVSQKSVIIERNMRLYRTIYDFQSGESFVKMEHCLLLVSRRK